VHIGTGNYNPKTARHYEDFGLLTLHEGIGEDVAHLFNNLSGFSRNASYEHLLVAPDSARAGMIERIRGEVAHHAEGRPARIRMKANSIVDEAVIDELYRASQAGVPIDLMTRGICAVRPGVPGLSETIRVRSVLGRFLEHSRIFWFENGGTPSAWIGSADLMHRNLDRRVEALVQLPGQGQVEEVGRLLDLAFDERTSSWWLEPSGEWVRHSTDKAGVPLRDLQETLIAVKRRRRSLRAAERKQESGPA
jgi:polyphosphate kinase